MRFAVSAALHIPALRQRTKDMKKFLSTAAIIAALPTAAPALAQRMGPGPTANTGTGTGVLPQGGFGPSSPLKNLNAGSGGLSTLWTVQEPAAPVPPGTEPSQALQH
jgi:hypothetical protein